LASLLEIIKKVDSRRKSLNRLSCNYLTRKIAAGKV
jgi:hypothetical protein